MMMLPRGDLRISTPIRGQVQAYHYMITCGRIRSVGGRRPALRTKSRRFLVKSSEAKPARLPRFSRDPRRAALRAASLRLTECLARMPNIGILPLTGQYRLLLLRLRTIRSVRPSLSYSVRPDGAGHQRREVPSRELSVDLVAGRRVGRATDRVEALRQRPPRAVEQSSGP